MKNKRRLVFNVVEALLASAIMLMGFVGAVFFSSTYAEDFNRRMKDAGCHVRLIIRAMEEDEAIEKELELELKSPEARRPRQASRSSATKPSRPVVKVPEGIKTVQEILAAVAKDEAIPLDEELKAPELADRSLAGILKVLERDGFASVVGAEYVGVYLPVNTYRRFADYESKVESKPLLNFSHDEEFATTGCGWKRLDGNGEAQYLVFDVGWWSDTLGTGVKFSLDDEPVRLSRDVTRIRFYLREVGNDPDGYGFELRCYGKECDVFALAFALHLCQLGRWEEAQSIYDALRLRPDAADAALARLRRRVKFCRRHYPDPWSWNRSIRKRRRK